MDGISSQVCYAFSFPGNRTESTHRLFKCWDMLSHLLPDLLADLLLCFLLSLEHGGCQALQVLGDVLGANLVIHKGPANTGQASSDIMCC